MKPSIPNEVFVCLIDMAFPANEMERALGLLRSTLERTQTKIDCLTCTLSRDVVTEGRVHYSESWAAENRFREHARSEEFRRVLVAIDMCCEEPRVTLGSLAGLAGLTYLSELRRIPTNPGG